MSKKRVFPVVQLPSTTLTRAGSHALKVKIWMGPTTRPILAMVMERYESPLYKADSKRHPNAFIPLGAVLVWNDRRKMYVVASGLPEAIALCDRVRGKYKEIELPDLDLLREEVGMLWNDALLHEARCREMTEPEYYLRAHSLIWQLVGAENEHKQNAERQLERALHPKDSRGQRNWSAVLAVLTSAGRSLGLREDEIGKITGHFDVRKVVLLGIRRELLGELEEMHRQIVVWRVKFQTNFPPQNEEQEGVLRSVVEEMTANTKKHKKISLRPFVHMTTHASQDLLELVEHLQGVEESDLEYIVSVLDAIMLGIEIQKFGLLDLATLRVHVGAHVHHKTLVRQIPWGLYMSQVNAMQNWVAERLRRGSVLRHNVIVNLSRDLMRLRRAVEGHDVRGAHAELRKMARHI